jgi:hypothetical protein
VTSRLGTGKSITVFYSVVRAGFKTREIALEGTGGEALRAKGRYQSTAEPRGQVLKYTLDGIGKACCEGDLIVGDKMQDELECICKVQQERRTVKQSPPRT